MHRGDHFLFGTPVSQPPCCSVAGLSDHHLAGELAGPPVVRGLRGDVLQGPAIRSSSIRFGLHVAMVQYQWQHFRIGAPPILEPILGGDWDVHWGYGVLIHGRVTFFRVWIGLATQEVNLLHSRGL